MPYTGVYLEAEVNQIQGCYTTKIHNIIVDIISDNYSIGKKISLFPIAYNPMQRLKWGECYLSIDSGNAELTFTVQILKSLKFCFIKLGDEEYKTTETC